MTKYFFRLKLIMALVISMHLTTHAQFAIGIEGGYTANNFKRNITSPLTEKRSVPGYTASVTIQYTPHRLFALQTGAQLMQKNYELKRTGPMTGTRQAFYNTYVQIPVTGQVQAHYKKITGYYKLGAYGAYWISGRCKGTIPNIINSYSTVDNGVITDNFTLSSYNEKYTFQTPKDRRFEFGLVTGAGLLYRITDRLQVSAGANYYHSLTDQQKRYSQDHSPGYNRTICITAGTIIAFHHNKTTAP
jgi:outer membrane protein with beta-barrel domain